MNKLKREYQFFKQQTSNVRVLLMTNLLYAFVLPVVEIFVGAYVMRRTFFRTRNDFARSSRCIG